MHWCRYQQCFSSFTMLLAEGFSETGLFQHLSDHVFGAGNFGKTKSMRVMFFLKMFKIYSRFQKRSKKFRKSFVFVRKFHLNWYRSIVSLKNGILFTGSQCVNRQSQDLTCQKQRHFQTQFTCQWSMNMKKVLWCRFQQCFGTFTMLLIKGFSQTWLS